MKITVYTVTSDTCMGLETSVFPTEKEAMDYLFDSAIKPRLELDEEGILERARAEFDEDVFEAIDDYGSLESVFTWDSHDLDIPDPALVTDPLAAAKAELHSNLSAGVM